MTARELEIARLESAIRVVEMSIKTAKTWAQRVKDEAILKNLKRQLDEFKCQPVEPLPSGESEAQEKQL